MTPFSDWQNSYSADFPQKEVMTLDLIMQLKDCHEEEEFIHTRPKPMFTLASDSPRSYSSFDKQLTKAVSFVNSTGYSTTQIS